MSGYSFASGNAAVIASGWCRPPAVVFTWISALDARIGAASFTVQSTLVTGTDTYHAIDTTLNLTSPNYNIIVAP